MYLIKFLCHKRSIAATALLAAALTYTTVNCAFGAVTVRSAKASKDSTISGKQADSTAAPAATLKFAPQSINTTSGAQTFTIRGSNLAGDVTVSTNPPFALSKDSVNYDTVLSYSTTDLASNQTVYVIFKPIVKGNYTDSITNISAGAVNKIITLSGRAVTGNWTTPADHLDANNIITPNGDGKNDTWVIKNIDQYPNNSVKVMDKSGNVVYSKQGYTNDWDGTYNNAPLSQGTYYYIVDFGADSGLVYRGFITIVRD